MAVPIESVYAAAITTVLLLGYGAWVFYTLVQSYEYPAQVNRSLTDKLRYTVKHRIELKQAAPRLLGAIIIADLLIVVLVAGVIQIIG